MKWFLMVSLARCFCGPGTVKTTAHENDQVKHCDGNVTGVPNPQRECRWRSPPGPRFFLASFFSGTARSVRRGKLAVWTDT